nr:hypothetical protein CoNPh37_CDS0124 [Staphylococcus phage S-CoN_Ph37]
MQTIKTLYLQALRERGIKTHKTYPQTRLVVL